MRIAQILWMVIVFGSLALGASALPLTEGRFVDNSSSPTRFKFRLTKSNPPGTHFEGNSGTFCGCSYMQRIDQIVSRDDGHVLYKGSGLMTPRDLLEEDR